MLPFSHLAPTLAAELICPIVAAAVAVDSFPTYAIEKGPKALQKLSGLLELDWDY